MSDAVDGSARSDQILDLERQLTDPAARSKLVELMTLMTLLEECVVPKSYIVPDNWTDQIVLTELGDEVRQSLSSRKGMRRNELKLALFLHFGCSDGSFVDLSTDVDRLRLEISRDLLNRKILLPYIFGRELHDLAADRHPERSNLNWAESNALLKELPIGVFQHGRTVTGPFGALKSDEVRSMFATKSVPGYHCSDIKCVRVHSISLNTADTKISKARIVVREYVEKHYSSTKDDHGAAVRAAVVGAFDLYRRTNPSSTFDCIADGLSLEELKNVVATCVDAEFTRDSGRRAIRSKQLNHVIQDVRRFCDGLDRASLLQVLMLHSDRAVVGAVDLAVRSGGIPIDNYSIRTSKVNRWDSSEWAEIGPYGIRQTSKAETGFVSSNLQKLLHNLYVDSDHLTTEDLAYSLDLDPTTSAGELVDIAIRNAPPSEVINTLIVPNRRTTLSAADQLHIPEPTQLDKEGLLSAVTWKLGVHELKVFAELEDFAGYAANLDALPVAPERLSEMRAIASNLFPTLEICLAQTLHYTGWALTSDHYLSEEGFVYDPESEPAYIDFLAQHAPVAREDQELKRNGKNTLGALGAGFGRLGSALSRVSLNDFERDTSEVPERVRHSDRPFAFPSALPYHNLESTAKHAVIDRLVEVSRIVQNSVVLECRNTLLHGNAQLPSQDAVGQTVRKLLDLHILLQSSGFYPRVFTLVDRRTDLYGRSTSTYSDARRHLELTLPLWPVAPRLSSSASQLIVMPIASLAAVGPLRFTLKPRPGKDPYWDGWPKRWRVRRAFLDYESTDDDVVVDPDVAV